MIKTDKEAQQIRLLNWEALGHFRKWSGRCHNDRNISFYQWVQKRSPQYNLILGIIEDYGLADFKMGIKLKK